MAEIVPMMSGSPAKRGADGDPLIPVPDQLMAAAHRNRVPWRDGVRTSERPMTRRLPSAIWVASEEKSSKHAFEASGGIPIPVYAHADHRLRAFQSSVEDCIPRDPYTLRCGEQVGRILVKSMRDRNR